MKRRFPDPESLRSAYEWLAAQTDPNARLVGYFGLLRLAGPDQLDVAERLLDLLMHEMPAGRPIDLNSAARAMGEAARLLDRAGRLAGYFESLLGRAEAGSDATFLLRRSWVTDACAAVTDADTRREFLTRLIALVDAGAYQPDHAAAAQALRERCRRQLADQHPVRSSPPDPDLGHGVAASQFAPNDRPSSSHAPTGDPTAAEETVP